MVGQAIDLDTRDRFVRPSPGKERTQIALQTGSHDFVGVDDQDPVMRRALDREALLLDVTAVGVHFDVLGSLACDLLAAVRALRIDDDHDLCGEAEGVEATCENLLVVAGEHTDAEGQTKRRRLPCTHPRTRSTLITPRRPRMLFITALSSETSCTQSSKL